MFTQQLDRDHFKKLQMSEIQYFCFASKTIEVYKLI